MSCSTPSRFHSWRARAALACSFSIALAACEDEAPTAVDVDLLPPEPVTIAIELPWADFGSNLAVYGGYSAPALLEESIVARAYGADALEARTLIRFTSFPASASLPDSSGTVRTDFDLSYHDGYVVAFFDPIASTNAGPVTLGLGALEEAWHPPSATWDLALDTVGEQRAWSEPGAGPVTPLTTRDWDPALGDSVQFFLDSAQMAGWNDPTDAASGARIELLTEGVRLRVIGGALRIYARSSINPDTVLSLTAQAQEVTFVYDVDPAPPLDGMRVGGAPSWRTVLDIAVPSSLTGPPGLCAAVGCPFALAPRHVSYAALVLRTRRPAEAFQPTDSVALDVRPVLSRAALPKSPLGNSLIADPAGQRVDATAFAVEGAPVEIPVTGYVKAFLGGPDPAGRPPPGTLALLATPEPGSFTFAEFFGPGGANEPVLKLIVTVSPPMELQ